MRENKSVLAAEKILQEVLKKDGVITFPINPFKLLKNKNVVVTFSNFDKLEGLLLYDKNKTSVVSVNLNRPITRQRFTAAHELGHLLLHKEISKTNFLCPIYGAKSIIEKEADEFASHLLMPTTELEKKITEYQNDNGEVELENCLYIAEYFGVSFESCVKTIRFRLNKLSLKLDNSELDKVIRKFQPQKKRLKLLDSTNDIMLLINAIEYSYFSMINIDDIVGIKFIQELVNNDNRLENIEITEEKLKEIYADFRINGSESIYCTETNQAVIESLGNLEMNRYCLETKDTIDIFKIKDLNKLLYKYSPYPEYSGLIRTSDNMIYGGKIQPVSTSEIFDKMDEINTLVTNLKNSINEYNISDYIKIVSDIHYRLTVLHPFNDGNGRIARAFMNWLLRIKGLPPVYFDSSNKKEYLEALNEIDKGGNSSRLELIIIKAMIKTMSKIHDSWK